MSGEIRSQPNVIARKPHKCGLCGEAIVIGSPYRLSVYKDGPDFVTSRIHHECDRVTVLDKWVAMDWEMPSDPEEFRVRRDELRSEGRLA